ncbi:MAG: M20 family metallopeptidase [Deltaproteobacteria bacterium]|nr:M20 family metallopeptidase [Deltaproteobacteria bacterium]
MNQRPSRSDLYGEVDRISHELWGVALEIANKPELAFEERYASQRAVEYLKSHGFEVQTPYLWLDTAFRASFKLGDGGRRVAFLAEYDALPEIGHACGHPLIAGMSIGAVVALSRFRGLLPGEIVVIGTPAEEQVGGKVLLADGGAFDDIDCALMVHPSDRTEIVTSTLALFDVTFEFKGMAAHASAFPFQGRNALDAAIMTYCAISALRQQLPSDVRVHGIILEGGRVPNIIPDSAKMRYFVRAPQIEMAHEILKKIAQCAKGASLSTQTDVEIHVADTPYFPLLSNERLCSIFAGQLDLLHVPYEMRRDGKEAVGSSDVGNVSGLIPTLHPTLQVCERGVTCHTRGFASAAVTDRAKEAMVVGTKALAGTALEILSSPEIFKEVREEFLSRTAYVCDRLDVGHIS